MGVQGCCSSGHGYVHQVIHLCCLSFAANAVAQEDSRVCDSAGSRARIWLIFGDLWVRPNETGCFGFVDLLNAMPLCPTYHGKSNGAIGTEFVVPRTSNFFYRVTKTRKNQRYENAMRPICRMSTKRDKSQDYGELCCQSYHQKLQSEQSKSKL